MPQPETLKPLRIKGFSPFTKPWPLILAKVLSNTESVPKRREYPAKGSGQEQVQRHRQQH